MKINYPMEVTYKGIRYGLFSGIGNPLCLRKQGGVYMIAGLSPEIPYTKEDFAGIMKEIKYQQYEKQGRTWKVKSRSSNGVYNVRDTKKGLVCDCLGFKYHGHCWHVDSVADGNEKETFKEMDEIIPLPWRFRND